MTLIFLNSPFSLDRTSLSEDYEGFTHVFFGPYLLFLNFLDSSAYLSIGPYLLYFLPTLLTSVRLIVSFDFFIVPF